MYAIELQEMSPQFLDCWKAAGNHLNQQVQDGIQSWLRAHPFPPFLEHLSFRLGNQLFFIRVEDIDQDIEGPGSLAGLNAIADGCKGHPCRMPMKRKSLGSEWAPVHGGWGLLDARTGNAIDPYLLVSEENIEMTEWEIHDVAVQAVNSQLEKEGRQLMSWQGNPNVDPAIWFVGDSNGPEWVAVRAVRYPADEAPKPENWEDIASQCARISTIGHFASIALVSTNQRCETQGEPIVPLWRGHGVYLRYGGLQPT